MGIPHFTAKFTPYISSFYFYWKCCSEIQCIPFWFNKNKFERKCTTLHLCHFLLANSKFKVQPCFMSMTAPWSCTTSLIQQSEVNFFFCFSYQKTSNSHFFSSSSSSRSRLTTSLGLSVSGLKLPPDITILWICGERTAARVLRWAVAKASHKWKSNWPVWTRALVKVLKALLGWREALVSTLVFTSNRQGNRNIFLVNNDYVYMHSLFRIKSIFWSKRGPGKEGQYGKKPSL